MGEAISKKVTGYTLVTMVVVAISICGCGVSEGNAWQRKLARELPVLGHRNWIVVADSAYPAQSRAGIETIATGQDQIEVVEAVLKAIDKAEHVRANVYLDAEMKYVLESDAPGINRYRKELAALLDKRAVKSVAHEELIAKLDESAKTFRVLILKTTLTVPYTSVFLELDCGYWNSEAEQKLRQSFRRTK